VHGRGSVQYVGTSTSRFLECIRYIQILGVFLYDVRYIQKMEELLLLSVSNKYTFLGQAVIISGVFRGILMITGLVALVYTAFQYSLHFCFFCVFLSR